MKTKMIPAIVMLLGGSVACIVSYINHYTLKEMLVVLTLALIVFLIFGVIIRLILDSFDMPENKTVIDGDGEVVEKQGEDEAIEGEETAVEEEYEEEYDDYGNQQ